MKIAVEYNGSHYYWVDTITIHDEYDYACAILVSSAGYVFPICVDKITVDDTYNFEKERQNSIERLKHEQAQLKLQMELDAALAQACRPVPVTDKYF